MRLYIAHAASVVWREGRRTLTRWINESYLDTAGGFAKGRVLETLKFLG